MTLCLVSSISLKGPLRRRCVAKKAAWLKRGMVNAPEVGFILREKHPLSYHT